MMLFQLSLILCLCIVTLGISKDSRLPSIFKANISQAKSRNKRFLIFPNGGVAKLVVGFSQAVDLLDIQPFRQLSLSYSIHMQYTPPLVPVYWWTYFSNNPAWAHDRSSGRQRHLRELLRHNSSFHHNPHLDHYGTFVQRKYRQPAIVHDASRIFVYKALETMFESKGLPGDRCLLRTICEISQRPLYENSAIHGIINAIFSPSVPNVHEKYLRAKRIGDHGVDCERIYWSCDAGIKWFDQMSYYI